MIFEITAIVPNVVGNVASDVIRTRYVSTNIDIYLFEFINCPSIYLSIYSRGTLTFTGLNPALSITLVTSLLEPSLNVDLLPDSEPIDSTDTIKTFTGTITDLPSGTSAPGGMYRMYRFSPSLPFLSLISFSCSFSPSLNQQPIDIQLPTTSDTYIPL